jgi:hypothetical protein
MNEENMPDSVPKSLENETREYRPKYAEEQIKIPEPKELEEIKEIPKEEEIQKPVDRVETVREDRPDDREKNISRRSPYEDLNKPMSRFYNNLNQQRAKELDKLREQDKKREKTMDKRWAEKTKESSEIYGLIKKNRNRNRNRNRNIERTEKKVEQVEWII